MTRRFHPVALYEIHLLILGLRRVASDIWIGHVSIITLLLLLLAVLLLLRAD